MMSRMKKERLRLGLTQTKLAASSDLSTADVSRIETGRFQPYPDQLKRLAKALNVKPGKLLEMVD